MLCAQVGLPLRAAVVDLVLAAIERDRFFARAGAWRDVEARQLADREDVGRALVQARVDDIAAVAERLNAQIRSARVRSAVASEHLLLGVIAPRKSDR